MFIIGQDDSLYVVGQSSAGLLGLGVDVHSASVPTPVPALAGIPMQDVAVSERHVMALSKEGDVYTWGEGATVMRPSALGLPTDAAQASPALVEALADAGESISFIGAGSRHSVAVGQGQVFAWGSGELGRLGNGITDSPLPAPVEVLEGVSVASLAVGKGFSALSTAGGSVWSWGVNDQNQLGLGPRVVMDMNSMEPYPERVEGSPTPILQVAAGDSHCVALGQDGGVYYWGSGGYADPTRKGTFSEEDPVACVSAGSGACAAITSQGKLFVWGKNLFSGNLGVDSRLGTAQPAQVSALDGVSIAQVHFGESVSAAVVGQPSAPAPIKPEDADASSSASSGGFLAGLFG